MAFKADTDNEAGWFSADSSFYGDDEVKQDLEDKAAAFDPQSYWKYHDLQPSVIAFEGTKKSMATSATGELYNIYADNPSGRRLDETVDDFLTRLPPRTSQIADSGPWIYIANPQIRPDFMKEDARGFKERGGELLSSFRKARDEIENNSASKSKSVTGRKITPLRKQLEKDIFALARETGVTAGKWMLFPPPDDVNRIWGLIAHAIAEGNLGHAAKVAADDGSGDRARLICVYTADYDDKKDVKKVLQELDRLGLVKLKGPMGEERGIYYKADAYTWLELNSGNEYGVKPSLYSSKDVLKDGWL